MYSEEQNLLKCTVQNWYALPEYLGAVVGLGMCMGPDIARISISIYFHP
jgi:hypothetical protein